MIADIYRKTEKGRQVLKDRSVALPSKQRMAFILFDGKKTLEEIVQATRGIGVTSADIETIIRLGLIELVQDQPAAAEPQPTKASYYAEIGSVGGIFIPTGTVNQAGAGPVPESEYEERYAKAYPIAVGLTSSLGLRGFKLNLAVESAMGYKDLVTLLPKLVEAAGAEKCKELVRVLMR